MKKSDVFSLGRRCRAERSAINSGRRDSDKQTSVETMVSRFDGAVASVVVHIHAVVIPYAAAVVSRFSDLNGKEPAMQVVSYAGRRSI
jgi:hypothetical protein